MQSTLAAHNMHTLTGLGCKPGKRCTCLCIAESSRYTSANVCYPFVGHHGIVCDGQADKCTRMPHKLRNLFARCIREVVAIQPQAVHGLWEAAQMLT